MKHKLPFKDVKAQVPELLEKYLRGQHNIKYCVESPDGEAFKLMLNERKRDLKAIEKS